MAARPGIGWTDRYCLVLTFCLAAYAIGGKGFAYLGVPPLFITELLLVGGLMTMLVSGCMLASLLTVPALLLAALMALTVARTVPFVSAYGVDALRDSVLVLYGLFAFIVATLLLRKPERLVGTMAFLRWFTGIYVVAGPLAYIIDNLEIMPILPGMDVSLPSLRAGELGVHIAACTVFALLGLRTTRPLWVCGLIISILLVASQNRGGFLAILVPVAVALPFSHLWRRAAAVAAVGLVVLGLAYAADLEVPTYPRKERPMGARQAVDNVLSLVVPPENRQLDDTTMFRVLWWKHIREYTLDGRYFWTGKGFGVNLAVDDGFVVGDRKIAPLRSPHNSHMNILARTGVPGLTLWALFLASWAGTMLSGARRAWRAGNAAWGNLMLFVTCAWLANVVNASFDVALEGPMLGVWFWCQTGFGLGVVAIYGANAAALRPVIADPWRDHSRGALPAVI